MGICSKLKQIISRYIQILKEKKKNIIHNFRITGNIVIVFISVGKFDYMIQKNNNPLYKQ